MSSKTKKNNNKKNNLSRNKYPLLTNAPYTGYVNNNNNNRILGRYHNEVLKKRPYKAQKRKNNTRKTERNATAAMKRLVVSAPKTDRKKVGGPWTDNKPNGNNARWLAEQEKGREVWARRKAKEEKEEKENAALKESNLPAWKTKHRSYYFHSGKPYVAGSTGEKVTGGRRRRRRTRRRKRKRKTRKHRKRRRR